MKTILKVPILFSVTVCLSLFWTWFLKYLLSVYGLSPIDETFMAVTCLTGFSTIITGLTLFREELFDK